MTPTGRVVVVGGGLAGISAALECAERGAEVTLVERKRHLGGLTWSFRHGDMWVDNGQHVFLRCCTAYTDFLDRIGATGDVDMPARLDIPVLAPGSQGRAPVAGRLRRSPLPAPLHLADSLLRYPHIPLGDRLRLGPAVVGLMRLRLGDPELDRETFASWLRRHHQSPQSIEALWDLITVPTVNLPAEEASLAMAAKVFKTGLLESSSAADIGWSRVPLGRLHGERAGASLSAAGVEVRTGERVRAITAIPSGGEGPGSPASGFTVAAEGWSVEADGVVLAVPHDEAAGILPPGSVPRQEQLDGLGTSPIVDVHLVFDRPVTELPMLAAVRSPIQWVFDRTASSGLAAAPGRTGQGPQYLAVSLSAAGDLVGRRPEELVSHVMSELPRLLPLAADARVTDSLVTKEHKATFSARPGTAALRPQARTRLPGLAVAGAWTDTGWPATMEGAVRSGLSAAAACLSGLSRPPAGGTNREPASGDPRRTLTPQPAQVGPRTGPTEEVA